MFQLSSNATLFLKVFLPSIWLAFFGTFLMATCLIDDPYIGGFPIIFFRVGLAIFLLLGFAFFYITVFRLKRIDADEDFLYVSSYYSNYRYPYENVERVKIKDFGLMYLGIVTLKQAGSFGKKMYFLASTRSSKKFFEAYPALVPIFQD